MKGIWETCLLLSLLNYLLFLSPVLVEALWRISSKFSSSWGFSTNLFSFFTIFWTLTDFALDKKMCTSEEKRLFFYCNKAFFQEIILKCHRWNLLEFSSFLGEKVIEFETFDFLPLLSTVWDKLIWVASVGDLIKSLI